jgi:hypothetical protein
MPAQSSTLTSCARRVPQLTTAAPGVTAALRHCPTLYERNLKRSRRGRSFPEHFTSFGAGVAVALEAGVAESPSVQSVERRSRDRRDRRRHSRSGRRAQDPHMNWRRIYWFFGAYALFLSLRKLPVTLRRLWRRETVAQ